MACRTQTKRITLAHVAKESNVSVTTASLILSGRSSRLAQFQKKTVDRVRRVADSMGYRANLFASSLLASRSSFFALIMQGISGDGAHAWSSSVCEAELLRGVAEATLTEEIYPIVVTTGEQVDDAKIRSIERIMAGGVFGTLVCTPMADLETCMRKRIEREYPTVVVFPDPAQAWPANAIMADHAALGQAAGRLLSGQQVRRLLVVRDAQLQECQDLRSQGCKKVAEKAGMECREVVLAAGLGVAPAENPLLEVMQQFRPDGIFAMSTRASVSCQLSCRLLGINAGRDCMIVGSDCGFWDSSAEPRTTSIDVSWYEAGKSAIKQLIIAAESGESRFDSITLRPRLVAGSTCPVPEGFKV